MYPFDTNKTDNDIEAPKTEFEDSLMSSEAMQGDEALISKINELNDLRSQKA